MFGLGKKAKIARGIQAAMRDVLNGRFAKIDICQEICGTEVGAAWLFTEAIVQLSNSLAFVIYTKYGHNQWATLDYFFYNVQRSVKKTVEKDNMFSVIASGIERLQAIEGEGPERLQRVFNNSAEIVFKYDSSVDKEIITKFLDKSCEAFVTNCGEYFEQYVCPFVNFVIKKEEMSGEDFNPVVRN